MGILRQLQHWLQGNGPMITVSDVVPLDHTLRLWADTFPWDRMVQAIEQNFAQRFPSERRQGRAPVAIRVLFAPEVLTAEVHCSDAQISSRLRTDVAVMYACGIDEVIVDRSQRHGVLSEVFARFRSRITPAVIDELLALQGVAAIEEGLVCPEHVVVDTFPSEQGSQRVTDAGTLYKAKKNVLQIVDKLADHGLAGSETLKTHVKDLPQMLQTLMRSVGRQCQGHRNVLVHLVRNTEQQLLQLGQQVVPLAIFSMLSETPRVMKTYPLSYLKECPNVPNQASLDISQDN
jgi:hypothetical protein